MTKSLGKQHSSDMFPNMFWAQYVFVQVLGQHGYHALLVYADLCHQLYQPIVTIQSNLTDHICWIFSKWFENYSRKFCRIQASKPKKCHKGFRRKPIRKSSTQIFLISSNKSQYKIITKMQSYVQKVEITVKKGQKKNKIIFEKK